jgi:chitin synthase
VVTGSQRRHDLSWGTKGSDSVQAVDLGAVHGVGKHVEVDLVSAQQDIDIAYQDALDNIRLKRALVEEDEAPRGKGKTEQQQKDTYVSTSRVVAVVVDASFRPTLGQT